VPLGLPIGSGPVKSACKTLVGGRCKQSGMRNWRRRGAEAVLRLRAAQIDDEFAPLWGDFQGLVDLPNSWVAARLARPSRLTTPLMV